MFRCALPAPTIDGVLVPHSVSARNKKRKQQPPWEPPERPRWEPPPEPPALTTIITILRSYRRGRKSNNSRSLQSYYPIFPGDRSTSSSPHDGTRPLSWVKVPTLHGSLRLVGARLTGWTTLPNGRLGPGKTKHASRTSTQSPWNKPHRRRTAPPSCGGLQVRPVPAAAARRPARHPPHKKDDDPP